MDNVFGDEILISMTLAYSLAVKKTFNHLTSKFSIRSHMSALQQIKMYIKSYITGFDSCVTNIFLLMLRKPLWLPYTASSGRSPEISLAVFDLS